VIPYITGGLYKRAPMSPWAPAARAPAARAPAAPGHLGARGPWVPWVPGGHGCPGAMGARGPWVPGGHGCPGACINFPFYSDFPFISKGRIVTIPGFYGFFVRAPGETWGNLGKPGKPGKLCSRGSIRGHFPLIVTMCPFPRGRQKFRTF
jgi:hypothetical protein